MTIVQNLVYGNISSFGEAGIGSGSDYFAPRGLIFSLVVTNNSIYGNVNQNDATERPPQSGNQASFGSDLLTAENGLFIATDPYGTVACSAAAGYTVTATHNDAFYAGATQPLQCGTEGNGNVAADPQFLNPAGGDFHVQRTSPVVGAGNVSAPGLPPADLDGKNRTVCGSVDMGVYQTHPIPPVTLASSPNPSVGGSSVNLSAHVTGNCNIPTGVLTFFDGATPLGKGVLDGSGETSFTTSALTVGTHNVSATYPGDFNFDPSTSNTIPQVVTGYPTATALTASPDPAAAFQTITLQSAVSSQFGTPGGTVSFYAGTTLLGSANLNSSGQAQTTVSTLGAGTYSLTAVYNATTEYASSTSPAVTEVVNGAPTATSLAAVPNPSTFSQTVTFTAAVSAPQSSAAPTGTVSFRDGNTSLGQSAISASGVATFTTSALAVGSHAISAVYTGSSNDNPSTSSTTTQIVALAPVSVTLTPDPNPANQGQAVSLVVTVSAAGLPAPAGTVAFNDLFQGHTTTLATASLSGGQASVSISTLAIGTHTLTAVFAGSGSDAGGTSPEVSEVIQAHDFSIYLSPATISAAAGSPQQVTVSLSSLGSYAGTLGLSAASLPQYAAATFSPATVPLKTGQTASATLTLTTVQEAPAMARVRLTPENRLWAAALLVPMLFARRRGRMRRLLAAVIAAALLSTAGGCTTVSYAISPVAPGTYTIPITATDQSTGTTHSTNLTFKINR